MNVSLQPTNFYFSSILTDITDPALAAPTILAAARVILGQNLIVPSLVTSYADLGECDFTGYARGIVIVWGLPINDVDTTPTSNSPAYLFRATGTAIGNNVQNVAVCDGVAAPGTGILASGAFAAPIPVFAIGDGFSVVVGWNLGNVPGNLSAEIIQ